MDKWTLGLLVYEQMAVGNSMYFILFLALFKFNINKVKFSKRMVYERNYNNPQPTQINLDLYVFLIFLYYI